MNETDRLKLQRNYKKLTEVCYSAVSPHLISTFVLDMDMHADIEAMPTDKRKMERLLQLLPSRGDCAMKELIKALKPSYVWLATQLQEETGPTPDYDAVCNNILTASTPKNMPAVTVDSDNLKDIPIFEHQIAVQKVLLKSSILSTRWTALAFYMEIGHHILADIKREMATEGGTQYAIAMILRAWVSKSGPSKATFANLIKLIKDLEFNELTEWLIDLWSSLQHTTLATATALPTPRQ